ncbi:MAG: hypothetical protein OYH77_01545 [Pseudomonadota bacterium]|nr:hypothetical protein [Pseudomonadota bacterium]
MSIYRQAIFIMTCLLLTAPVSAVVKQQNRMQVQVALNVPSFSDKLQFYETLYQRPSFYPSLTLKGMTARKFFAFGWGVKFGYYYDSGFAAVLEGNEENNSTGNDTEANKNPLTSEVVAGIEPIYLTLIPLQAMLAAAVYPVGEWVRLDLGIGHEFLYVQEERDLRSKQEYKLLHTRWELHGVLSSGMSVSLRFLDLDKENDILLHARYELMFPYGVLSSKNFQRSELALGFTFETS